MFVFDHIWNRVPRRQVTHETFLRAEAITKEFTATALPEAVVAAIAAARLRRGDDADIEDVMTAMHPVIKAFCAERGLDISDWDAVPY